MYITSIHILYTYVYRLYIHTTQIDAFCSMTEMHVGCPQPKTVKTRIKKPYQKYVFSNAHKNTHNAKKTCTIQERVFSYHLDSESLSLNAALIYIVYPLAARCDDTMQFVCAKAKQDMP